MSNFQVIFYNLETEMRDGKSFNNSDQAETFINNNMENIGYAYIKHDNRISNETLNGEYIEHLIKNKETIPEVFTRL